MPAKDLKSNVVIKVVSIIVLVVILVIPTTLINFLINDRVNVKNNAIEEVSHSWSKGQTIVGPYITIPYYNFPSDSLGNIRPFEKTIYLLPNTLKMDGELIPEVRYRGIHEVVVYNSNVGISGEFDFSLLKEEGLIIENMALDRAKLNVGISDLKGIENQVQIDWDDETKYFDPSIVSNSTNVVSGINTIVNIDLDSTNTKKFSFNLNLKGSQHLYFTPVGKTTKAHLKSSWDSPSFSGKFLPDNREINDSGFEANWEILHLNRNYPQLWVNDEFKIGLENFGTDLMLPIDNYTKSDRVIKYAILFIALTFLAFFFVEIMNKIFIHPIQYLLVGLSLVVFYVLLVSFSEHLVYNLAYWLATTLTLLSISGYTWAITKSKAVGGLILGILVILYSFIFTIIQLEDYSLLIGSIGIFLILSFVMFMSRKIDWYELKLGDNQKINNLENKE
jgi:inner membrane protein